MVAGGKVECKCGVSSGFRGPGEMLLGNLAPGIPSVPMGLAEAEGLVMGRGRGGGWCFTVEPPRHWERADATQCHVASPGSWSRPQPRGSAPAGHKGHVSSCPAAPGLLAARGEHEQRIKEPEAEGQGQNKSA